MARRYTLFWDFVLLSMSAFAWPLLYLLRGPLVREAGAGGWGLVAMWPLGAALFPLILIALVELGRTRHRSITIGLCGLSLLGVFGLLTLIHVGDLRESLITNDLDQGGGSGFAHDEVSEHLEDDPIIGAKILRSPKLSQKLLAEVDKAFREQPTNASWSKHMTRAAWAAAAARTQKRPLESLLGLENGAQLVTALLAAEAHPDPAWKWLAKVVALAPRGSYRFGLVTAEQASSLARGALAKAGSQPKLVETLLLAAAQHPGLLSQSELDRLLELGRGQIGATAGSSKGRDFDRVLALRGELARKLAGRSTVGLSLSLVNPSDIDQLQVYAKESVRGLFHSAGFETTDGNDVRVKIGLRRVKNATTKSYQDSWVMSFDLGDGKSNPPMPSTTDLGKSADAATPSSSLGGLAGLGADGGLGGLLDAGAPSLADAGTGIAGLGDAGAPVGELINSRTPVELPVLIDQTNKRGWLFGVPPFYFDVMPEDEFKKLQKP